MLYEVQIYSGRFFHIKLQYSNFCSTEKMWVLNQ